MSRKEELEKIIDDAEKELAPLRKHENLIRWLEETIKDYRDSGILEEEVLSLVDAIYRPNGDLTDQD